MFDFNANPGDTIFDVYSRLNEGLSIVVTKIDSVELFSKKARRITVKCIDYFPESIEWVEGVGDFKGGIIPNLEIIPGGELYSITCFYNNGELLIHRPIYEYAGYEPGIPIVFDTVDIECIYPDLQCEDTVSVFDTIWFSDTLRYYDTIRFYDTLYLTVLHDSSLSEDIVLANDLVADIYPNPVDNLLYISFNRLVIQLSYVLIDNSGKQIYSSEVLSSINSIQLDLSGVTAGIYFLYLRHDDFQEVFRIIIQNSKGP